HRWTAKQTIVTTTDRLRTTSFQTTYSYTQSTNGLIDPNSPQPSTSSTIKFKDAEGKLLRTETKEWMFSMLRPAREVVILDNGQTSELVRCVTYLNIILGLVQPCAPNADPLRSSDGKLVDIFEYDYGASSQPG